MEKFETLFGECLCGTVSWKMHGPFDFFAMCQCSLCRKLTGSAFATNLFVKIDQFRWISGETNRFEFQMSKPSNFKTAKRARTLVRTLARALSYSSVKRLVASLAPPSRA